MNLARDIFLVVGGMWIGSFLTMAVMAAMTMGRRNARRFTFRPAPMKIQLPEIPPPTGETGRRLSHAAMVQMEVEAKNKENGDESCN